VTEGDDKGRMVDEENYDTYDDITRLEFEWL